MTKDLVVGALGSIIALPAGWFLREIYEKIIRPIGDRVTYRGASIEGNWETKLMFPDNSFNQFQIRLERHGYRVTGRAKCIEGYSAGHEFEFTGEFVPPLLTATYKALLPQSTERGAIALILSQNGSVFSGQVIYSDDKVDKILATECALNRVSNNLGW